MRRFLAPCLSIVLFLAACSPGNGAAGSGAECGNGVCESGESSTSCLQDCPASSFSGKIQTTYIKAEGPTEGSTINIAVMVASPKYKRYTDGAGVVVVIPSPYAKKPGFVRDPDLTSIGLVQVSFTWPGQKDGETGAASAGVFDFGGAASIKVLRDVIRFAGGRSADTNGRYIFGLASVPPLTNELGLYAFGDAALPAVKVLSLYGDQLQGLTYLVTREPTITDAVSSHETGYFGETGLPIQNPFYSYPASYGPNELSLNYTNLRWDPTYTSQRSTYVGRPYLDLDGSGSASSGDFVFEGEAPVVNGKRYYSVNLTQALLDNGALTTATWPSDLGTPQEVRAYWQFLQNPDRFSLMLSETIVKNLKVMLVFARTDHAEVAVDKPNIHQAYQGFRFEARLWVRLNPDRAYVRTMMQRYASLTETAPSATATAGPSLDFPDNPANTEPQDWATIGDYAYPGIGMAEAAVPLAAAAEMADRAHSGVWDENIGQVLYPVTQVTPTP